MEEEVVVGVELGGTSSRVAVARRGAALSREQWEVATEQPGVTLGALARWARARAPRVRAVGIASFGPLCLDARSPRFGTVTTTPKPGWAGAEVVAVFRELFPEAKIAFDTDVNAPALLEAHHSKLDDLCYVTVGTGVGVGAVVRGACVHGHSHPEAGHVPLALHRADAAFLGHCPFHGACAEGLMRVSALAARAAVEPKDLPQVADDHSVWDVFAFYLGQFCVTLTLTLCPRRIVIGGGPVSHRPHLIVPKVREQFKKLMAGYVRNKDVDDENYISASSFGPDVGLLGALHLAEQALV